MHVSLYLVDMTRRLGLSVDQPVQPNSHKPIYVPLGLEHWRLPSRAVSFPQLPLSGNHRVHRFYGLCQLLVVEGLIQDGFQTGQLLG